MLMRKIWWVLWCRCCFVFGLCCQKKHLGIGSLGFGGPLTLPWNRQAQECWIHFSLKCLQSFARCVYIHTEMSPRETLKVSTSRLWAVWVSLWGSGGASSTEVLERASRLKVCNMFNFACTPYMQGPSWTPHLSFWLCHRRNPLRSPKHVSVHEDHEWYLARANGHAEKGSWIPWTTKVLQLATCAMVICCCSYLSKHGESLLDRGQAMSVTFFPQQDARRQVALFPSWNFPPHQVPNCALDDRIRFVLDTVGTSFVR